MDTGAFYSKKERKIHWKINTLRRERLEIEDEIKKVYKDAGEIIGDKELTALFIDHISQVGLFFRECGINYTVKTISELYALSERYVGLSYWKTYKSKLASELGDKLREALASAVEHNIKDRENKRIRELNSAELVPRNVISVFESSLTRMLGMETDELSDNIIVVKAYYYDLIKDLILNGFTHNGERYKFFTASAGQIRTKKTVFIKEALWDKYEQTLMCGLTVDKINEMGGVNVNKFLAYLALSNSATDEWTDFDIDRCIVVPDFETAVHGMVDFVDDVTYTVERKEMDVSIEHTDGCGMILPTLSDKNFMFRAPWVKGLLASFDFRQFIREHKCGSIVTDIYGKEWDIIEDDIQIIFTKSQFKMHMFYSSWDSYKEQFKRYNCQAGTCKREEEYVRPANINYQMLQTLTDIKDSEILKLLKPAITNLNELTSNIEVMLNNLGVDRKRSDMNDFQKSLLIYPELLEDPYSRERIKARKKSLVKKYRYGKIPIQGKYTFIVPDLYAFCERLFLGIEVPNGLLDDGEVCCRLYSRSKKLDCLRAPHLYVEHPIRNNVMRYELTRWFKTDAVYTSSKDMISKVLQFDVDGDTSLVVADKTLIEVAERNMHDIAPLYYDMKKAAPSILTNQEFYNGMSAAWSGGNIGAISNNITKIWNSGYISDDEKLAVKLLVAENNFVID